MDMILNSIVKMKTQNKDYIKISYGFIIESGKKKFLIFCAHMFKNSKKITMCNKINEINRTYKKKQFYINKELDIAIRSIRYAPKVITPELFSHSYDNELRLNIEGYPELLDIEFIDSPIDNKNYPRIKYGICDVGVELEGNSGSLIISDDRIHGIQIGKYEDRCLFVPICYINHIIQDYMINKKYKGNYYLPLIMRVTDGKLYNDNEEIILALNGLEIENAYVYDSEYRMKFLIDSYIMIHNLEEVKLTIEDHSEIKDIDIKCKLIK